MSLMEDPPLKVKLVLLVIEKDVSHRDYFA